MRTILATILISLLFTSPASAGAVRLSAAASMTDVVRALITSYQKSHPETTFQANFAASGTLAKQIALGAPSDLVISANPKWLDYLVVQQRITAESVRPLAGNTLVLVGRKGIDIPELKAVAGLQRIAIGSPKGVPAGQYAEQALRAAGVWERLSGKLVMAKDVRQALIYADRGETDGAFVYKTDALLALQAVILLEVPQILHDAIIYPMGLTSAGADNPDAVAFFAFLQTAAAQSILTDYGFTVQ